MNLTVDQYTELQAALIEHQRSFRAYCAAHNLPNNLSLHVCPDLCWVASEHEDQSVETTMSECGIETPVAVLVRQPPGCHTIVCKI